MGYIRMPQKKIICPTLSFPRAGTFFEVGDDNTISIAPFSHTELPMRSSNPDHDFDVISLPSPRLLAESLDPTIIKEGLEEIVQHLSAWDPSKHVTVPIWPFILLDEAYFFYIKECLNFGARYFLLTRLGKYLPRPRLLAKILTTVRNHLPPDSILHVRSPVPPYFIPVLAYLGVDVIDTGFADLTAASRGFIYHDRVIPVDHLDMPLCNCQACSHFFETPQNISNSLEVESWLIQHNQWQFRGTIRNVRLLFRHGGLRELVEAQTHQSPSITALIRILNHEFSRELEATTPTFSKTNIVGIGSESLHRPVIARFRERVKARFTPLATSCVLIFPCSAKKPYNTSRSHQSYRKAINLALPRKFRKQVSEVIYTSPLDVVPRELEYTFPAAHYDIPVTGDWSVEEQTLTIQSLTHLLSKFPKGVIVLSHVEPDQQSMIYKALKLSNHEFIEINTQPGVTSKPALAELTTTLHQVTQEFSDGLNVLPLRIRTVLAVADYQFGLGASRMLFGNFSSSLKIRSWYPRPARIFSEHTHLATLNPSTGHLLLTLAGAAKLKDLEASKVYFDGIQLTGSTLFAIGVSHASNEIRPGDEVIIENTSEEIIGTGQAIMSGSEMEVATRGMAVKIRAKGS